MQLGRLEIVRGRQNCTNKESCVRTKWVLPHFIVKAIRIEEKYVIPTIMFNLLTIIDILFKCFFINYVHIIRYIYCYYLIWNRANKYINTLKITVRWITFHFRVKLIKNELLINNITLLYTMSITIYLNALVSR